MDVVMPDGDYDPFVKELMPGYLARRREELSRLEAAAAEGDFEALRVVGHNLHGSGGAYGLPRISELGRDLENAAHERDEAGVRAIIDAMRAFIDTV